MSKEIIIFPFGGNAREALISIEAMNKFNDEWSIIGFIDDEPSIWGKDYYGVKVLGGKDVLKRFPNASVLAVPGNPDNYIKRKEIIESLGIPESRFTTVIHPSVTVPSNSKIGYNVLLMSNVVISCGVKIGNHCVILPNTVISHESTINNYCCIGSNVTISGNVFVGEECYIGSGSVLKNDISVGKGSLLGLGSNVISNVDEYLVVAGNPARILRRVKK